MNGDAIPVLVVVVLAGWLLVSVAVELLQERASAERRRRAERSARRILHELERNGDR